MARVRALLKRHRIASSQTVQIGLLAMNRKTHQLTVNGESLTRPFKEFELSFKLASHAGKTLSRDQLLKDIQGLRFRR